MRAPNMSGLRARSTAAAVSVVAVALVVAGAALVVALRWQWSTTLRSGLLERTEEVANQVTADFDAADATVAAVGGRTNVVQVVDAGGTVLLGSPGVACLPPLVATQPAAPPAIARHRPPGLGGDPYLVATVPASSPDGPVVVIGATSMDSLQDLTRTAVAALLVGGSMLLLVVGAATRGAVGRSLHDVETIRSRVEAIDADGLADRVPVPATGDEVAHLADTMNAMLDRLDAAARSQRRFVADAGHELKSPLASMRASLDVAATIDDLPSWQESGAVLSDEVDRMSRLVADLLLLARADEGVLPLRISTVDLDDLVAAEARRVRSQTGLTVSVEAVPVQVSADPQRLAQVIRNLVDNAVRFAAEQVALAAAAANADRGRPRPGLARCRPSTATGTPSHAHRPLRVARVHGHRLPHGAGGGGHPARCRARPAVVHLTVVG